MRTSTWRTIALLRACGTRADDELDPGRRGTWDARAEPTVDGDRPAAPEGDEIEPGARAAWRAWMLLLVALFVRTPGPFLGQGLDQALDQYAAFMRLS